MNMKKGEDMEKDAKVGVFSTMPDSKIPPQNIEFPDDGPQGTPPQDEARIMANIPHIFEIEIAGEMVKLPLYPQTPGYLMLISAKVFDIVTRVTSLQSDKVWKKIRKFAENKNPDEVKEQFLWWITGAVDESQEIFQLLFETGHYDDNFTVLSEEMFKWHFTAPLVEEILDVFLKQNDMSGIVKKMLMFSQGQVGVGQG